MKFLLDITEQEMDMLINGLRALPTAVQHEFGVNEKTKQIEKAARRLKRKLEKRRDIYLER